MPRIEPLPVEAAPLATGWRLLAERGWSPGKHSPSVAGEAAAG